MKDFNGKANIIKLWVAGFPPMERRQAAYQTLLKQNPGIKELESIGAVSSDVQGDTANKVGAILAKNTRKARSMRFGEPGMRSAREPIKR